MDSAALWTDRISTLAEMTAIANTMKDQEFDVYDNAHQLAYNRWRELHHDLEHKALSE